MEKISPPVKNVWYNVWFDKNFRTIHYKTPVNMLLSEIIINRIKKEGPISFKDFMEMALYHPELGYYNSPENIIGPKGDFYTSVSLTPAFGAMIGRQIEEMWRLMNKENFTIVEYGAGTGLLCRDILAYLKTEPELFDKIQYYIIEKSNVLKQRQQIHLKEKVCWINNIEELQSINGCILSNEVVDNFAIHQVLMEEDLMEIFVDYKDGFIEKLHPAAQPLSTYFSDQQIVLPKQFRTEINLEAKHWMKTISASLNKGFIITIDYGASSSELYSDRKSRGTVVCYNKHQVNENPYVNIGRQDITAHVNFSALCHWGDKYGLETCGLTSQAEFLLLLGFKEYLLKIMEPSTDLLKCIRQQAFITHTLLIDMGQKFKVLIQNKGIANPKLKGLSSIKNGPDEYNKIN